MRRALTVLLVLFAGAWALTGRGFPAVMGQPPPPPSGFAVLELFTSEGCSSCPAADEVLEKLARDYAGRPVYPLSFHVDYWNDLGWQDRFSDASFSRRQSTYASALGRRQIYTPQLVINGRSELVGSRESAARAWIERALASSSAQAPVIALNACLANGQVRIRADSHPAPVGARLALLLVQRSAQSRVTRGENAQQTLRHVNVVRALSYASPTQAIHTLPPPANVQPSELSVVSLLEGASSHAVLSVVRTQISGACDRSQ